MNGENTHVAFDTDLCRASPEAAADEIMRLETKIEKLVAALKEGILKVENDRGAWSPEWEAWRLKACCILGRGS